MVHHYDVSSPAAYPTVLRSSPTAAAPDQRFQNINSAEARPPAHMERAILRLTAVHEAMDSLRRDFHDRLMAAREPLGVATHPLATSGQDKPCAPEGPLMDRIRALEDVVRDMSETVAGFRELFG